MLVHEISDRYWYYRCCQSEDSGKESYIAQESCRYQDRCSRGGQGVSNRCVSEYNMSLRDPISIPGQESMSVPSPLDFFFLVFCFVSSRLVCDIRISKFVSLFLSHFAAPCACTHTLRIHGASPLPSRVVSFRLSFFVWTVYMYPEPSEPYSGGPIIEWGFLTPSLWFILNSLEVIVVDSYPSVCIAGMKSRRSIIHYRLLLTTMNEGDKIS